MVAQCTQRRAGWQLCIGEGNDARVNCDEIGLLLQLLNIGQAEGIAKLGGEWADRIMAALVGAQLV